MSNLPDYRIKRSIQGVCISFLGMAAICSLLYPQVFDHYEYGISTFGSVARTAILYALGFAATITCLLVIAWQLRLFERTLPLRVGLWVAALCMAGIAITSFGDYSQRHSVYLVHVAFAMALAICQLALAFWIITHQRVAAMDYVLTISFAIIVMVSILPIVRDIPGFRSFPLREALAFVCAMGFTGRAALRASKPSAESTILE